MTENARDPPVCVGQDGPRGRPYHSAPRPRSDHRAGDRVLLTRAGRRRNRRSASTAPNEELFHAGTQWRACVRQVARPNTGQ